MPRTRERCFFFLRNCLLDSGTDDSYVAVNFFCMYDTCLVSSTSDSLLQMSSSFHPDNPPRSSYRQGPFFVGGTFPRCFKFWSPLRFAVFVDSLIMIEGPLVFSILSVTTAALDMLLTKQLLNNNACCDVDIPDLAVSPLHTSICFTAILFKGFLQSTFFRTCWNLTLPNGCRDAVVVFVFVARYRSLQFPW